MRFPAPVPPVSASWYRDYLGGRQTDVGKIAKPVIYTLPKSSVGVWRVIYKTCHF